MVAMKETRKVALNCGFPTWLRTAASSWIPWQIHTLEIQARRSISPGISGERQGSDRRGSGRGKRYIKWSANHCRFKATHTKLAEIDHGMIQPASSELSRVLQKRRLCYMQSDLSSQISRAETKIIGTIYYTDTLGRTAHVMREAAIA